MSAYEPSIPVTSKGMWQHEALDKTWKRVEERVQRLADKEETKIQANLQIKDVMKHLENVQKVDRETKDKHGRARQKFNKTLELIQTFGGIVSTAVTPVFAPSAICFNAITIVIQGYQKYEGIYEGLAELFGKFLHFFDRLDEYHTGGLISNKLARITCQFLEVFIEVCERSIELRSSRHKASAALSTLFLNDKGIQGHLKRMEELTNNEHSLVSVESWKLLAGVDGRTKSIERLLQEDMSQRGNGQDDKAKDTGTKIWKQNLIKALGFPDDMLARSSTESGVTSEPKAEWIRTMDQYTEKLTTDMGRWIEDLPEFKSWTDDHRHPSTPLLVLEGDSGTGKSCLMTYVHHHLLRMAGSNMDTRRSVAYLFLDSNVQKGENKQNILAYVSRCLLWQCATSSESLIKSMSTIYEEKKAFNGPLDWWSSLLLENNERERLETTFYFLVDGLDAEIREVVPLLQQLTKQYAKSRIRVCLTTRPETTRTLRDSCKLPLEAVRVQVHNQEDVKNYIISRMDQMPTLQDTKRSAVVEWREKILKTLADKSDGDFFTLTSNLDDISKIHMSEDICEVLESMGKKHVDSIDLQIQILNQDLTQTEILEVNKIILWVAYGRSWFTLDEMDSILSTHRGVTDTISGLPGSLMSLSEKLKNRYTLFQVSPGSQWVKFRSDKFKSRITDLSKSAGTRGSMDNISGIHETEIKIVEHFLSQVCPGDLYSRFRFAEFFNQKRHFKEKDCIRRDSNNAELQIAITCLSIITEPRDDKTARLHPYALRYFLDHMQAVDLVCADRRLKAQMGPLLLRLFTEVSAITSTFCVLPGLMLTNIGRYLSLDRPNFLRRRREWLWTSKGAQELLRWLTDPSVVENITSKTHLDLIKRFTSAPSGCRFVLLQAAARFAATLLFQTPERQTLDKIRYATIFLHGYVSNENPWQNTVHVTPALAGMGESLVESDEPKTLHLGDLEYIEDWAFKTLGIKMKNSLWESQMAHLTKIMCLGENVSQTALQRTSKALELDKNNWRAWYYKAVFGVKDDQEAVDILQEVTQRMEQVAKSCSPWLDIDDRRSLLADLFLELGNRLWSIGKERDSASRCHLKCLEYHNGSYDNYKKVLLEYGKAKAWSHVIGFLVELTRSDKWTPAESVHLLVYQLFNWPSFFYTVALAVKSTGRWDVIESLFLRVIKRLEDHETEPFSDALFVVRYSYGSILSIGGHDEDTVIHLWQKAIDDGQASRYKYSSISTDDLYGVVNKLAPIYSRRGQAPNSSPESVEEFITRFEAMVKLSKETWTNRITSCCLARLYLTIGQEKEAKHAVLELVRSALEMLSDDDPSNDGSALYVLASVFATMNDEAQTRAAWHLMSYVVFKPPKEITQQDGNLQAIGPNDESHQGLATGSSFDQAQKEDPTGRRELDPADDSQKTAEEKACGNSVETSGLGRSTSIEDKTKSHEEGSQEDHTAEVYEVSEGRKVPESTDTDEQSYRTEHAPVLGRHNFGVRCDGCRQRWNAEDDLHTCNNCSGRVQFCGGCMDRFSRGELGKTVCDKNHRLTYIPKWSPCQASVTGNTVMVPLGGEILTLENWKLRVWSSYITAI